jgi:hypothetical protein
MKFNTSVAALICGLSTTAWAGAPTDSVQDTQGAYREGASVNGGSGDTGDTSEQLTGWQYLNGQATPSDQNATADGQVALPEESGNDQVANLQSPIEDDDGSLSSDNDPSSSAENNSENYMARNSMAREQPAGLDALIGGMRDKLVVILPEGWQGSVPDLLAALQDSSDAAEILILKPDGQDADMSSESSEGDETPDSK